MVGRVAKRALEQPPGALLLLGLDRAEPPRVGHRAGEPVALRLELGEAGEVGPRAARRAGRPPAEIEELRVETSDLAAKVDAGRAAIDDEWRGGDAHR